MSFLRYPAAFGRKGIRLVCVAASLEFVLASSGCLAIFDTSKDQCATDADCTQFAGTYCSSEYVCASRIGHCDTNAQCLTRNPEQPHVCRDHGCVSLSTGACSGIIGDLEHLKNEDTVILGFVNPITDPYRPLGLSQVNAVDLARSELMKSTTGLPAVTAGGSTRPVVYVKCDENPGTLPATFDFLIDKVKVPAIVGPSFSGDVISIANSKTIRTKTLVISSASGSPLITGLPTRDPRLVWRTVPSDALNARVISTLIPTTIEQELKGPDGPIKSGQPMKVAVVHKGDAFGIGLERTLFQQLTFNNTSATANADAGNYRPVNYGDPSDPNNKNPDQLYSAAVSEVVNPGFAPHLVVFIGTAEIIKKIFVQTEQLWGTSAYRPKYLFATPATKTNELLTEVTKLGTPGLRGRILGTEAGTTGDLFTRFQSTYGSNPNYNRNEAPPGFIAGASYDAAYMLHYAMAAVGGNPLTGESIARGLERLIAPGISIDVGDTGALSSGFLELAQGRNINLRGVSGLLDFDINAGDAETDIQVWCTPPSGTGFAASGLYYNSTNKALTGTFNCK